MTIGFFGEPTRPIVEAIGMPISMCVAWLSPIDSLSRITAQLRPFDDVELMPNFLKKPFSCAMTIGEQSVSAIMPKRTSVTSGPSPAVAPDLAAGLSGFCSAPVLSPPHAEISEAAPTPNPVLIRNRRRVRPAVETVLASLRSLHEGGTMQARGQAG